MSEKSKPVILEIDDVRIRRSDENNLQIERLETVRSYDKKSETWVENKYYRFKGYYATLRACLKAIYEKELLVDEDNIADLTDVLRKIEESEDRIIYAIKEAK